MTIKLNPYIAGNPVGGGEAFIGRADVLRDVLRVLKSPHENGMVLYGQRRIGKTSVLQELTASLPQKGPYAPVYFDLQDKAALPLDQVLRQLAEQILYKFEIPEPDNLNGDFPVYFQKEFLPYVLSELPEETALVLLFDEFDVLSSPSDKQAGSAFFPYLRDLMSGDKNRLKFIFVIGRRPEDLSSVYLSLFKGVKSCHVSLLSADDTADLVQLSEKNDSLKWPDEAVSAVYKVTGGHPYLTQQLCQVIWDNLYDDEPEDVPVVRSEHVEQAVPEAVKSATNSLEWLWNGLGPAERVVASALAEAGPDVITQDGLEKCLAESGVRILIGELQNAPRVLEEWDLIKPEDGGYRIRVEMLRRWIVQRKPLSRVQDEIDRIIPLADNLFNTAYGFYQGNDLEEATSNLRKAIKLNPNHLKANQLLAEIFLASGNTDDALSLLEKLYEYNPSAARPRLVQALLAQAEKEKKENERLVLYERILELESEQPEAVAEYKKIWEKRGDEVLKNNETDAALEAYKKAGAIKKIEDINQRSKLENLYQQALTALNKNQRQKSQKLFAQVLVTEPSFRKATYYMHIAVTGVDIKKRLTFKNFLFIFVAVICVIISIAAATITKLDSKSDIDGYLTQIEHLKKTVTEREQAAKKNKKKISVYLDQIDNLKKIVSENEEADGNKKKEVDKYLAQIDTMEKSASEHKKTISRNEKKIDTLEKSVREHKKTISRNKEKIDTLKKTISDKDNKIDKQKKEIDKYLADIKSLKKPIRKPETVSNEVVKSRFKDNGDGTVTDSKTGLMWQQSGSDKLVAYKKKQAYVDKLNKGKGFASYKDWRLPTIKELKSLLEKERQSNGLFINPIFDSKQRWCWSSDKRAFGGAWYVNFNKGNVDWNYLNDSDVRAVRSQTM
ncbi:MAG: DUF1566 domain-containing protein [Desulfobacterales bacterium]|nr:DUF1566 domain-containing protein [Desulfobacterales bacterium]